jgi:multiple sugar transport system substrate-binding protein
MTSYQSGAAPSWMTRPIGRRALIVRGGQLAGVAAVGGGLLAACSRPDDSGGGGKAGSITVGLEKGSSYSNFHMEAIADFTKKSGISVKWIEIPHDNMHERFLTESIGGGGGIDVFQADQPWVAEFANANYLEPLDSRVDQNELKDFLPVALETLTYDKKLYGLPYMVHNSVLYYRKDLFSKAGITVPPKTWDEYRAIAKQLTDRKNGIFGTVIEGKNGVEPGAKFMDILQQAGGRILDDAGNVAFNSPATIDSFRFLLAVQYDDRSSPPGGPGFDNGDTANLFTQGKLAMMANWPYMYGMAADPKSSKVVDQYAVVKQPGKVSQTAEVFSWGYAIATGSKKKDEAFEFLKWASSPDTLKTMGKSFINPVPRQSVADQLKADTSLNEGARQAIATMTESVAGSKTIPSNPKWPDVHNRVSLALSRIMTRQATPEQEVPKAAADIQKIVAG